MMRAAVYRGIDDVRIEHLEVPTIGAGEALVRIHSCGVCGTDLKKIRHGLTPPPMVFGHEMAGTIAALGEGVRGWSVGDRAAVMHHVPCQDSDNCYYCRCRSYAQCPTYRKTGTTAGFEPAGGGFAEYIRVFDWVVDRGMVHVPDDVRFEAATFIEPVNTCLKAITKADVRPEQTALVIGQGQIGLLFTQLLKLRGAVVYSSDRLAYRQEQSVRFGATQAFSPDGCDIAAELRRRTSGRGADIAIVAVPSESAVRQAMETVRPGGKTVLFAHTHLGDAISIDAGAVCCLEKDLIGSYSSDIELQDEAAGLIFDRHLNVIDLMTHSYPLDEISAAIDMAASPRDNSLKVMVNP